MNRIEACFERARAEGRAAFIPFFTAGDPSLDSTRRLIVDSERAGADLIELGFPFSDPVADGPVIQASYTRVLERGQRTREVLDLVSSVRSESEIPIVAMASYSLVFRQGPAAFVEAAVAAGLDGATVPDLPIEEAEVLHEAAAERDFRLICFATPLTTPERRRRIAERARGFIYYISVAGITGARTDLPPDLTENLRELKALTDVPVAVGFGVSGREQAAAVAREADGVIVGSAIVRRIAEAAASGADAAEAVMPFIRELAEATRGARG
jgi:tryptophan synthase alpha chain